MFKRTLLSSAIVVAGGLGASFALAEEGEWGDETESSTMSESATTSQSAGSGELPSFSELDTDGDGNLTEEELQANAELADIHSELDENQDGMVDQTEFAALEQTHGSKSKSETGSEYEEYESETDY